MNDYTYKIATLDELDKVWDKNIADNAGDMRWIEWGKEFIRDNIAGLCQSFVVLYRNQPIGEGTLAFSPQFGGINNRLDLADGVSVANLCALRMDKQHEGKGHISALVKLMEQHAKDLGYKRITVGVEPKESRNLAIYLHWGYDTFVRADYEADYEGGALVLYYAKDL